MKLLHFPQDRYFADDVGLDRPSLNSGIAQMLIDPECTPRHAWAAHPKLGGAAQKDDEDAEEEADAGKVHFDIGHAIHREILGRGSEYVACEFRDWRTKAARATRDAIRADGKTPLLQHHYDKIVPIAASARLYMASEGLPPMDEWETEVVYTGETRHGWPTRCMVDAWHPGLRIRMDLKSAVSLSDRSIQKKLYEDGYAFQDEWYQRGTAFNGDEADQRLILFIDKSGMHLHRIVSSDPFGQSIVSAMADRAEEVWNECMTNGFRGWPGGVSYSTPSEWWVKSKSEYGSYEIEVSHV